MLFTTNYKPTAPAFRTLPTKELKEFFRGFMENIQTCIGELKQDVLQTPGYENWEATFLPDSLNMLGNWLSEQVGTRDLTPEEIQAIESSLKRPIEFRKETLNDKSNSLVVKTGMYFGEVFLKNYPSLKWEQRFGGKTIADYGQPVITGFKVSSLNPIRIVNTFAAGYAFPPRREERLQEFFQIWANKVL